MGETSGRGFMGSLGRGGVHLDDGLRGQGGGEGNHVDVDEWLAGAGRFVTNNLIGTLYRAICRDYGEKGPRRLRFSWFLVLLGQ